MNQDVYLSYECLDIQGKISTTRRIGLKPEILEWLLSRFGSTANADENGIRFWSWTPRYNVHHEPIGARVWISDKAQRLLFKLTWGGQ